MFVSDEQKLKTDPPKTKFIPQFEAGKKCNYKRGKTEIDEKDKENDI